MRPWLRVRLKSSPDPGKPPTTEFAQGPLKTHQVHGGGWGKGWGGVGLDETIR